ncbi:hypothetical protein EV702DRAFT_144527 [Suillus placidus]|uniref:Uncharacterized protein n=1 Tax=Suillus placidus TaxID=48579 RepID=A0A9P6ZY52_9AGAM|nr:hypothetical protein EV702DRAFT_144527 [Suillus placidus]
MDTDAQLHCAHGWFHALGIDTPILAAKQIQHKSRRTAIFKGLIILQVAWFALQHVSRAIYHFETTPLEVVTLAFAVLSVVTYALW